MKSYAIFNHYGSESGYVETDSDNPLAAYATKIHVPLRILTGLGYTTKETQLSERKTEE